MPDQTHHKVLTVLVLCNCSMCHHAMVLAALKEAVEVDFRRPGL